MFIETIQKAGYRDFMDFIYKSKVNKQEVIIENLKFKTIFIGAGIYALMVCKNGETEYKNIYTFKD